jgi:hypothetical protein
MRLPKWLLILSLQLIVPGLIIAAKDPTAACQVSKLKAAATAAAQLLTCQSKAAKAGVSVDPACMTKANQKLTDSFTKAESKGTCASRLDLTQVSTSLDTLLTAVLQPLAGAPSPSQCSGVVITATGKFAKSSMTAVTKYLTSPDDDRLASGMRKGLDAFSKAISTANAREVKASRLECASNDDPFSDAVEAFLTSLTGTQSSYLSENDLGSIERTRGQAVAIWEQTLAQLGDDPTGWAHVVDELKALPSIKNPRVDGDEVVFEYAAIGTQVVLKSPASLRPSTPPEPTPSLVRSGNTSAMPRSVIPGVTAPSATATAGDLVTGSSIASWQPFHIVSGYNADTGECWQDTTIEEWITALSGTTCKAKALYSFATQARKEGEKATPEALVALLANSGVILISSHGTKDSVTSGVVLDPAARRHYYRAMRKQELYEDIYTKNCPLGSWVGIRTAYISSRLKSNALAGKLVYIDACNSGAGSLSDMSGMLSRDKQAVFFGYNGIIEPGPAQDAIVQALLDDLKKGMTFEIAARPPTGRPYSTNKGTCYLIGKSLFPPPAARVFCTEQETCDPVARSCSPCATGYTQCGTSDPAVCCDDATETCDQASGTCTPKCATGHTQCGSSDPPVCCDDATETCTAAGTCQAKEWKTVFLSVTGEGQVAIREAKECLPFVGDTLQCFIYPDTSALNLVATGNYLVAPFPVLGTPFPLGNPKYVLDSWGGDAAGCPLIPDVYPGDVRCGIPFAGSSLSVSAVFRAPHPPTITPIQAGGATCVVEASGLPPVSVTDVPPIQCSSGMSSSSLTEVLAGLSAEFHVSLETAPGDITSVSGERWFATVTATEPTYITLQGQCFQSPCAPEFRYPNPGGVGLSLYPGFFVWGPDPITGTWSPVSHDVWPNNPETWGYTVSGRQNVSGSVDAGWQVSLSPP